MNRFRTIREFLGLEKNVVALLFCRSFETLIPAFILRGLKEFGEPTRKALILDLSPEERLDSA